MTDASTRRQQILDHVLAAANLAGRSLNDIRVIAVSKGRTVEEIEALVTAGQTDFGENRVQEALSKWPEIQARHEGLRLHGIGQLQSNKAEEAVKLFDSIHTVDRPSLVEALAKAIGKTGRSPQLFVQVNIGEEQQKGGCAIAELPGLLEQAKAAGLEVAGLMGIPPMGLEPAPFFGLLAKLADRHGLTRLSMGMSGDYREAVMLGATDVRIGTAMFEEI